MLRAIREIQPRWVVGENVLGLVNWNGGLVFHEVQAELEAEGYEVQPFILPAASVSAPHRRDRVWFCAYRNAPDSDHGFSNEQKGQVQAGRHTLERGGKQNAPDSVRPKRGEDNGQGKPRQPNEKSKGTNWQNFPTEPPICSGDDGLPDRLDGITFPKWRNESIKAYGNAIVPQVAHQIFKAIKEYENLYKH